MDNAKIIDFVTDPTLQPIEATQQPENLAAAIQTLIQRLREANPLKQTG